MNYRKSELLMGILLLVFVYLISGQAGMMVSAQKVMAGKKKPVVVVDVGHGGTFYRRKCDKCRWEVQ